jgi:anti-sigma B factor antagonist
VDQSGRGLLEVLPLMASFEATTSTQPGRVVVALAGECDLSVRDEFESVLLTAVDGAPVVVVDLARLDFLDSSGLHGLITAHHAALARGGRVSVVNASGVVADVLDVTGVGALLGPPADGGGPA